MPPIASARQNSATEGRFDRAVVDAVVTRRSWAGTFGVQPGATWLGRDRHGGWSSSKQRRRIDCRCVEAVRDQMGWRGGGRPTRAHRDLETGAVRDELVGQREVLRSRPTAAPRSCRGRCRAGSAHATRSKRRGACSGRRASRPHSHEELLATITARSRRPSSWRPRRDRRRPRAAAGR